MEQACKWAHTCQLVGNEAVHRPYIVVVDS